MKLASVYRCLADPTRLRILHLLAQTPLCVCHLQEILNEPQVKISKHLAYLRKRGMVTAKRAQNWMIYSIPEKPAIELEANLRLLRAVRQTEPKLERDLRRLNKLACCRAAPDGALELTRNARSRSRR